MNPKRIEKVLTDLSRGDCTVAEALEELKTLPYEDLKYAKLDHHRELRKGIPEAIYTPGKTKRQLADLVSKTLKRKGEAVFTRMTPETFDELRTKFGDSVKWHEEARIATVGLQRRARMGKVLVVTAGTSDIPVAVVAAVTA